MHSTVQVSPQRSQLRRHTCSLPTGSETQPASHHQEPPRAPTPARSQMHWAAESRADTAPRALPQQRQCQGSDGTQWGAVLCTLLAGTALPCSAQHDACTTEFPTSILRVKISPGVKSQINNHKRKPFCFLRLCLNILRSFFFPGGIIK